jgi:hypothetical protein
MNIRSNYGSGITILVALDGRENGMLGTHEILPRLINEDFISSPQETGGKVVERRYN